MKKIASFEVNHNKIKRGVYVSRTDSVGDNNVTTFDIRMKEPNNGCYIDGAVMHTIEHLGATYLRNEPDWKNHVIYFGPMGCKTGFYLILIGILSSRNIYELMLQLFDFIKNYEGEIPGSGIKECGNYKYHNLEGAKLEAQHFYDDVLSNMTNENFEYQKD